MERNKLVVFRGEILSFYFLFFGQKCHLKTTKWIPSISNEMKGILLLDRTGSDHDSVGLEGASAVPTV
jgi:hypothetical protein